MQIRLVRPAVKAQAEIKVPGKLYFPAQDPVEAVHELQLSSIELNWITSALGSFNSKADGAENTCDLFNRLDVYCDDNGTDRRWARRDTHHNSFYPA